MPSVCPNAIDQPGGAGRDSPSQSTSKVGRRLQRSADGIENMKSIGSCAAHKTPVGSHSMDKTPLAAQQSRARRREPSIKLKLEGQSAKKAVPNARAAVVQTLISVRSAGVAEPSARSGSLSWR
eukprot:scaffold120550_cov28-Tisochrysis_lutea.AAC.3